MTCASDDENNLLENSLITLYMLWQKQEISNGVNWDAWFSHWLMDCKYVAGNACNYKLHCSTSKMFTLACYWVLSVLSFSLLMFNPSRLVTIYWNCYKHLNFCILVIFFFTFSTSPVFPDYINPLTRWNKLHVRHS